jgi:hypothetical protein
MGNGPNFYEVTLSRKVQVSTTDDVCQNIPNVGPDIDNADVMRLGSRLDLKYLIIRLIFNGLTKLYIHRMLKISVST